ncbi:MAG: hypothetical protein U0269_32760 [Polyangiales bacterium]
MDQSKQCPCCGGFLVAESCPNCAVSTGARRSPWVRIATAVVAAGTAVTLAACYGLPPPAPDGGTSDSGSTQDSGTAQDSGSSADAAAQDASSGD